MKFSKILNHPKTSTANQIVEEAEQALSEIFTELAATKSAFGSGIGGDPMLLQLVVPYPHYCDLTYLEWEKLEPEEEGLSKRLDLGYSLSDSEQKIWEQIGTFKKKNPNLLATAGTNGRLFFWNPGFLLSKSKIGRRLLVGHEGLHANLMHPSRRGHRIAALWNIAIDFKANHLLIADLRARRGDKGNSLFLNPAETFKQLGDFANLEEYARFLRDPLNPPEKLHYFSPIGSLRRMVSPGYLKVGDKAPFLLYAEPNLPEALKQPESIYDYLLKQIPRCKCGKLFHYKTTKEYKDLSRKLDMIRESNAEEI